MGQVSTLLVFLTLAAPAPAATTKVGLQAIEAQPGKNEVDKNIDAKLAKKLQTTLKLMGVSKPDLKSLDKTNKSLKVKDSISMTVKPYVVKVTCKKIDKDKGTTVSVELYKETTNKKTKKKEKKRMVPSTKVTLSSKDPYHVMTVMQSDKKKTVFVVSK